MNTTHRPYHQGYPDAADKYGDFDQLLKDYPPPPEAVEWAKNALRELRDEVAQQAAAQAQPYRHILTVRPGEHRETETVYPASVDAEEREHRARLGDVLTPVYTRPATLVGLSDERIMHLWFAAEPNGGRPASWHYARSVERALAEANGMELIPKSGD